MRNKMLTLSKIRTYILYCHVILDFRSIGLFKQSPKHDRKESSQMEFSKAVYQDSMSLLRRKVQHSHQTKLTDLLKTEH